MRLQPVPAMTEEEALEYLFQKDIPRRVWDPRPGLEPPALRHLPTRSAPLNAPLA